MGAPTRQGLSLAKPNPETWEDLHDIKVLQRLGLPLGERLSLYTVNGKKGRQVSLENWYRGKPVFLVCGGPSLTQLDLSHLRRPGVVTFGVNNVWTVFRPTLWCCIDRPANFVPTGWEDPTIVKFAPIGKLNDPLSEKRRDGKFVESARCLRDMPSVFYFPRNEWFQSKQFFTERTVNWGCHKYATDEFGMTGARSVMLAAFRLIHYLGFKQVYIIGADFGMKDSPEEAPAQNYAWKQWRHQGSVRGNNRTYGSLNQRLRALLPHLTRSDLKVFNCTPGGNLTVFPRMDYREAVDRVARECEKKVDTEGWYNQKHHQPK